MDEYIKRETAVEKLTAYCELRMAISGENDEFLRGLKMTSLSDNGREKNKTTVAYKKLKMWSTTKYFT